MNLHLSRMVEATGGIYGVLAWEDRRLVSMEREWMHNRSYVSCVPCGEYSLEPFDGAKYRNTWALVGSTVSAYQSQLPRFACVIHAAEYPSYLAGCLAVGYAANASGRLLESEEAVADLLGILSTTGGPHRLTIGGPRG